MANPVDLSTATSAEGQALQLIYAMNNLENANVDSAGNALTNNIQIASNDETGIIAITLNLPVSTTVTPDGASYAATPFLVN